ncbi:MAG TPA: hypothetical protein VK178_07280 [Opitutaceae bacterium]|nr:hypothetical protein [Opitutaceae bacterium]
MQPDFPFPETLWSIATQLRLLRAGRKHLVLLPHGIMPDGLIAGLHKLETTRGLLLAADLAEFIAVPQAIEDNTLGLLLGYGIPRKPEDAQLAITLLDGSGHEVLTVMADATTEEAVAQALARMGGETFRVIRSDPFAVLRARAAWWLHFFDTITPAN